MEEYSSEEIEKLRIHAHRYIHGKVKDWDTAEDLVQDTMILAWHYLSNDRKHTAVHLVICAAKTRLWHFGHYKNYWRYWKYEEPRDLLELEDNLGDLDIVNHRPEENLSPLNTIYKHDMLMELYRRIGMLPKIQRRNAIMIWLCGHTIAEVARAYNVSSQAVMDSLKLARKKVTLGLDKQ